MQTLIVKCQHCGAKNKVPIFKQHLGPLCGKCGQKIDPQSFVAPQELTDHTFPSFLHEAPLPLLVDFYSPTCGPCQMIAPAINDSARLFYKQLLVAKVDTNRNHQTAMRFQVRGVPTLIFFRKGQPVDQITGAIPRNQLIEKIRSFLV